MIFKHAIMKKLFLLFILISGFAFGQEYQTYSLSTFPEIPLKVYAFKGNKEGKFEIRVQIPARETYSKTYLQLNDKNYSNFMEMVNLSRTKFIEWSKVAEENKVNDMTKEIKKNEKDVLYYLDASFEENGKFYSSTFSTVGYYFRVLDGKPLLIFMNVLDLSASQNRYIKNKGYTLAFNSVDEIDNFIKMLDLTKINNFLNGTSATQELFK